MKDLTSGKLVVNASVPGAACVGATCTYSLTAGQQSKLRDGRQFKWWVISSNSFGSSPSLKLRFTTQFPRTPAPVTPADNTILSAPAALTTMEWQSGGTALTPVTYRLRVRRVDNGAFIFDQTFANGAGLGCDATKCQYIVEPALQNALRDGRNYEWWVIATTADGSKSGPKFTLKARFP